jgi:hypothetical protein
MSAEEILITHDGYTDTAYPTCGDTMCTQMVLRCVGVSEEILEAVASVDINDLDIGENVQVTVALLGESDSCEWCATCGIFLRHGLTYEGDGEAGCQHGGDGEDRPDLPGPHIDLKDRPAMREYWGQL